MKKRHWQLSAIFILILALVIGCAPQDAPAPPDAPAAPQAPAAPAETPAPDDAPAVPPEEVREITAIMQIGSDMNLNNNPVIQAIEDATGVRMIIEAPPSDGYGDRVRILAATGDLPDLIHFGADINAQQWAAEGLLLDVTDWIPNYPNLMANISQEQFGDTIFLPDGRIYGIPKPNAVDYWGVLVNARWLNNLGLEPPRTIEDWVNVSRAFTNDNPNGDGSVTFGGGLHSPPGGSVWHLQNDFASMAYSISGWHHGMPDVDGSARLQANKSLYIEYLTLLRDMFAEGIIDREFITHSGSENHEKLAMNRVGFAGVSQTNFFAVMEQFNLEKDDFMFLPPFVLNEGDTPQYAVPPSNWMAYYINANAADPDAVLRVLDFGNSQEGFTLMHMGIEGLHFDSYCIDTRTVVRSDEQNQLRMTATGNMFAVANAFRDRPAIEGGSTPEMQAWWREQAEAAMAVTEKVMFGFTKMIDRIGVEFPDQHQALGTLEVRFVTGEASLDELISFLDNDWRPRAHDVEQDLIAFMTENPPRVERFD